MQDVLAKLLERRSLSEQEAEHAFHTVLTGKANEAQVGAMLALLQARGVTLDELVGAARVMRRHVTPVPVEAGGGPPLIDTCGTGGAPKTFNISTAAAIVAASAEHEGRRVRVAKHGGRSRSGRGSAEVLEALGVNIDAPPHTQAACLDEAGVCFSFAIHHHPAMRFAAGPRKSLGFPTIFNLLGPLTNPARAPRQLLGVYDRHFAELVAHALQRLGAEHAMVVHGFDGLDEITTTDRTWAFVVEDGAVRTEQIDPAAFGIGRASLEDLRCGIGSVEQAAACIRSIIDGEPGPRRDIVVLNAGAALLVGGVSDDLGECVRLAGEAIDSGAARRTLGILCRRSHDES